MQGLEVAPSGYYEWLHNPISNRAKEDARLLRLIRASFIASHGIYGAPRVFLDLREAGETCSKHRVERLMRQNGLRALHGYRTRRVSVSKPSVLIPNVLKRRASAPGFAADVTGGVFADGRGRCSSTAPNGGSGARGAAHGARRAGGSGLLRPPPLLTGSASSRTLRALEHSANYASPAALGRVRIISPCVMFGCPS